MEVMMGRDDVNLWEVIIVSVLVSVHLLKIQCSLTLGNATRS